MISLISVTSSGLSSINRIIRWALGHDLKIDRAMSFRIVVLPALGGDTISPLWPLPIGAIRSTTLIARDSPCLSSFTLSFGKIGVRSSNATLFLIMSVVW